MDAGLKELGLVQQVMKSKIRIFVKFIQEAVCEEQVKTKGKELGNSCNIQVREDCDLSMGQRGRLKKFPEGKNQ